MPHEQHDCFSPFNQSDHCFLRLLLLLPSFLLKLLIFAQSYEQSKSLCKKTARNLRTMEREGNRKTVTSSKREQPKTFHRFLLSLREAMPRPRRKTGGRIEFVSVLLRKGEGKATHSFGWDGWYSYTYASSCSEENTKVDLK